MKSYVDGHKNLLGVNSSADIDAGRINSRVNRATNMTFRGDIASTRPAFRSWRLKFYDAEDKSVFESQNVTGVFFYNGVHPFSTSCIIVAVGDRILRGEVFGGTIEFFNLYSGIDRKWQKSFFCQAEELLIWQNGKDYPLYWDGNINHKMNPVYSSSMVGNRPMMIGNLMVYAHGRIFLATENDLVYASDHFYSQGIGSDKREAVLKFSESFYPSSGDGFGAPSDLGKITYLGVIPRNPTLNGHGEVIVGCENGWFSIDPTPQRNEWTRNNIQTIVSTNKGNASPYGAIVVNGDVWFRDTENGVSSLRISASEVSQDIGESSIGYDVAHYLLQDTPGTIDNCVSGKFDRYVFFSVGHKKKEVDGHDGVFHRYATGIVVADLNRGSSFNKEPIRWDGIWTGLRVTGMAEGVIGGIKKGFFTSLCSDGKNRIFSLSNEREDYCDASGYRKIKSSYLIGSLFSGETIANKTLNGAVVLFKGVFEETLISIDYSSDGYECYSPLDSKRVGCDNFCQSSVIENKQTGESCNNGDVYRSISGIWKTKAPCISDSKIDKSLSYGYSFSVKIKIEGFAKIIRCDILSSGEEKPKFSIECENSECKGYSCCEEEENYTL